MNEAILTRTPLPARRQRAFTLIELLVVTGVILILAGITFALAARINASAKMRSTENVIRALDQILGEYELVKGPVPAMVSAKAGEVLDQRETRYPLPNFGTPLLSDSMAKQNLLFPLVDGRVAERTFPILYAHPSGLPASEVTEDEQRLDQDWDPPQPTVGLFLFEAARALGQPAIHAQLGSSVTLEAQSAWGWQEQVANVFVALQFDLTPDNDADGERPILAPRVLDAWGRPIRFVHPAFQGGAGAYAGGDGTTFATPLRARWRLPGPGAGRAPLNFDRSYRPYIRVPAPGDPGSTAGWQDAQGGVLTSRHLTGDGDEGRHPAGRPYFYSAGPDGNPGARALNVYVDGARPQFPAETARFAAD